MKQNIKMSLNLPTVILKEGRQFVAYSPALDLSTCGKTHAEARRRFHEIVEIFFEELLKKGTTEEVLSQLGWEKIRQKTWSPPTVISYQPEKVLIPMPMRM